MVLVLVVAVVYTVMMVDKSFVVDSGDEAIFAAEEDLILMTIDFDYIENVVAVTS